MKRFSLILCLVLIVSLSGIASAQIVLGPADFGTPGIRTTYLLINSISYGPYGPLSGSWPTFLSVGKYLDIDTLAANYYAFYFYDVQGAIEFNLSPVIPLTFTSKDFTARLDGLNVNYSYQNFTSGPMNVDLFDMGDGNENGNVSLNDFNSTQGNRIARLPHVFGGAPANFSNIDVTCEVRNDLFGTGQTDFSGFILISPDAEYVEIIGYDPTTPPTLTIYPGVAGPKCGGGGGGGGGGGCFIANAAR